MRAGHLKALASNEMYIRLRDKTLSDPVLRDTGFLLNHAEVFIHLTEYNLEKKTLLLKLNRFPIDKKTAFSKTIHSKESVNCELVIRNVEDCKIENTGHEFETVTILFGLHFDEGRIYFCSAQEDHGKPCYSVDCRVSEFDIELTDKKAFANQ